MCVLTGRMTITKSVPPPMNRDLPSTIMVVDDDSVQRHLACSILEKAGMTIIRCEGAVEALCRLDQGEHVDTIVTDLQMPGIDGWRFCRLLRSPEYEAYNHTPILVISACFRGSDAQQLTVDLGANAFLSVPYEPARLRNCVRELLKGQYPRAEFRVLIIEERESPLQKTFESRGCTVACARSGEEGLRQFHKFAPKVVIFDYDLPDLFDHTLLRTVKSAESSVVTLVLTSESTHARALEFMRLGSDEYVRKPYDPEYVMALFEKACHERALLRVQELLEDRTMNLRDSEARFRSLVEGIEEIIVVSDHQGIIQHVNAVGAKRLEWLPKELVGRTTKTILPPEGPGPQQLSMGLPDGGMRETTYCTRMGRRVDVEVVNRPIIFNSQPAVMMVARDITQRKRAEEERMMLEQQLQQAQKMEAIGTLAGGVAHDFNNLLTVILGTVFLLKTQAKPGDNLYQDVRTIETVVHRAKALTDQLLGFARRGKYQHTAIDVKATIREVVAFLTRTLDKKISLREEILEPAVAVMGDPGQLHQVLLNLSVNARDAMPDGGELTYRLEEVLGNEALQRRFPALTAEHYVVISVQDTGTGIPADVQQRMFEPFFTTKGLGKGTGMGLAMAYGIIQNHGGVIDVQSEVGQGTTFALYLPLTATPAPLEQPQGHEQPVKGSGCVLLVDDEDLVRNVGARLLRHLGYEVVIAADGREAVECYRLQSQDIRLVIIDMIMPRMNGQECYRALRALNPSVKAILATGYDHNHAAQELMDEGVVGFVQKPYDLTEFSRIIDQALRAPVLSKPVPLP